jgi:Leucine-rich repeat (LRR) protein
MSNFLEYKANISRLAISSNPISVLPASFARCQNLIYLNMKRAALEEIPSVVCSTRSLAYLYSNQLLDFPTLQSANS